MTTQSPLCPFGCGTRMVELGETRSSGPMQRREGESDVKFFERDYRHRDHPRSCAGHRASQEAWSMRAYGVPDTSGIDLTKATATITVTFELDVSFYAEDLARERLRDAFGWNPRRPDNVPYGMSGGGLDLRQTNRRIDAITIKES